MVAGTRQALPPGPHQLLSLLKPGNAVSRMGHADDVLLRTPAAMSVSCMRRVPLPGSRFGSSSRAGLDVVAPFSGAGKGLRELQRLLLTLREAS